MLWINLDIFSLSGIEFANLKEQHRQVTHSTGFVWCKPIDIHHDQANQN